MKSKLKIKEERIRRKMPKIGLNIAQDRKGSENRIWQKLSRKRSTYKTHKVKEQKQNQNEKKNELTQRWNYEFVHLF